LVPEVVRELPPVVAGGFVGGILLGVVGGVAGFLWGLHVYAPTAWAAAVEVGVPAVLLGALTGALVGAGRSGLARISRTRHDRHHV
jgi:hypothetical protein